MKTKGRRQSKNVEDVRSPVANALYNNKVAKDDAESTASGPFDTSLRSVERYRSEHPEVSQAKGPFARMVDNVGKDILEARVVDRRNRRFQVKQLIPNVTIGPGRKIKKR